MLKKGSNALLGQTSGPSISGLFLRRAIGKGRTREPMYFQQSSPFGFLTSRIVILPVLGLGRNVPPCDPFHDLLPMRMSNP